MPVFDFKDIRISKYVNTAGVITYTDHTQMGDAISMDLQLKFAEGRLYAKGSLAEYLKLATGGTLSAGVKYIKVAAQKLLFGATDKLRTLGSGETAVTVTGLQFTASDQPNYVGLACYAPDMVDGVLKYTCMFVSKALFGPPGYVYKTKDGNTIVFQTPTSTGEFLPDDSPERNLIETATCDTEADAIAWCKLVRGET